MQSKMTCFKDTLLVLHGQNNLQCGQDLTIESKVNFCKTDKVNFSQYDQINVCFTSLNVANTDKK